MTTENEKTPQQLLTSALNKFFGKEALLIATFTASVIGVTLYAVNAFGQTMSARVDAGVQDVSHRAQELERKLEDHIQDSGEVHRRTAEDMHELQMDIRALYKTMTTGERSPRLERPPNDGGQ